VDTTRGLATVFPALTVAQIQLDRGDRDGAAAAYALAGPLRSWTPSPAMRMSSWAFALPTAIGLDRQEDIELVAAGFEPLRGRHVANGAGAGVYMGLVELQLGLAAAVADLQAAVSICDANSACGHSVQASVELASALARRQAHPGTRSRPPGRARADEQADRPGPVRLRADGREPRAAHPGWPAPDPSVASFLPAQPAKGRTAMTYIHIAKVKGLSVDDFRRVNDKMTAPADTDGLLVIAAGADGNGLVVTSVWQSKAQKDRYEAEQLLPTFQSLGLAQDMMANAEFTEYAAEESYVR
jgi:hypothetical protein